MTRSRVPILGVAVVVFCFAAAQGVAASRIARNRPVPLRDWNVSGPLRPAGESTTVTAAAWANAFVGIAPCRIVDTRYPTGPYGGPPFAVQSTRTINIPGSPCVGIPAAAAYSLNFTIINYDAGGGFVTAYPAGGATPYASTVTFGPNPAFAVSNTAIVTPDASGSIEIYSSGRTDLIIDINGYFTGSTTKAMGGANGSATLFYLSVPPDRVSGGHVWFTLFATDGTSQAALRGEFIYTAISGVTSCAATTAVPVGTPPGVTIGASCGVTTFNGLTAIAISDTVSFVPTTHEVHFEVHSDPPGTVTIVP